MVTRWSPGAEDDQCLWPDPRDTACLTLSEPCRQEAGAPAGPACLEHTGIYLLDRAIATVAAGVAGECMFAGRGWAEAL